MACGLLQRVAALRRVSFAFLLIHIHIGVSVCFSSPATTEVIYVPKEVAENLVPRQAYAPAGKAQDDQILLPRRRIKDHSTTFRIWCAFIASWILAVAIGISTKRSLDKAKRESTKADDVKLLAPDKLAHSTDVQEESAKTDDGQPSAPDEPAHSTDVQEESAKADDVKPSAPDEPGHSIDEQNPLHEQKGAAAQDYSGSAEAAASPSSLPLSPDTLDSYPAMSPVVKLLARRAAAAIEESKKLRDRADIQHQKMIKSGIGGKVKAAKVFLGRNGIHPQHIQNALIKLAIVQGRVNDIMNAETRAAQALLAALDAALEDEIQRGQRACARIYTDLRDKHLQALLRLKRPALCAFSKLDCKLDDVEDGVDHSGEAEEELEEEFPVDEEFLNNLPQV